VRTGVSTGEHFDFTLKRTQECFCVPQLSKCGPKNKIEYPLLLLKHLLYKKFSDFIRSVHFYSIDCVVIGFFGDHVEHSLQFDNPHYTIHLHRCEAIITEAVEERKDITRSKTYVKCF
jgi:hypothetical protein